MSTLPPGHSKRAFKRWIWLVVFLVVGLSLWLVPQITSDESDAPPTTSTSNDTDVFDRTDVDAARRRRQETLVTNTDVPPGDAVEKPVETTVKGIVRDAAGAPVAAATVRLLPYTGAGVNLGYDDWFVAFDRPLATVRTKPDGRFAFAHVADRPLVVAAHKQGWASTAVRAADTELTLTLTTGPLAAFEVVDEDAAPLAGVQLIRSNWGGLLLTQEVAITDADGRATLHHAHNACVYVVGKDRVTTVLDFDPPQADTPPTRVVLPRGLAISGRCIDSRQQPVAGVALNLEGLEEHQGKRVGIVGVSAADGRFRLEGVLPRGGPHCQLIASCDGWVRHILSTVPGERDVTIVMYRSARVFGHVVLPEGAEVGQLEYGDGDSEVASSDGSFELLELPPGRNEYVFRATDAEDEDRTYEGAWIATVKEGETLRDVEVELTEIPRTHFSFPISVELVDANGEPVAGQDVTAWSDWGAMHSRSTDAAGKLTLSVMARPNEEVRLTAYVKKGDPPQQAFVAVKTPSKPGEASGPIRMQLGPQSRLRVTLCLPDGSTLPFDPAFIKASSRDRVLANGTLSLGVEEPLALELEVPDYGAHTIWLTPPHPPLREEVVHLDRGRTITARIHGADSRSPCVSLPVEVIVIPRSMDNWSEASTQTDPDGRFSFEGLADGRAIVNIYADDEFLLASRVLDLGGALRHDLGDIQVLPAIRVRGRVVDRDGKGLNAARVGVLDKHDIEVSQALTGIDGWFECRMPQGTPLFIQTTRCRFASQLIPFTAANDKQLPIVMERGGRLRVRLNRRAGSKNDLLADELTVKTAAHPTDWDSGWAVSIDEEPSPTELLLGDLPAGQIEIVWDGPHEKRSFNVTIQPGRTMELEIDE